MWFDKIIRQARKSARFRNRRDFSHRATSNETHKLSLLEQVKKRPDLDFDYMLNPANRDAISENISRRKQVGNIDRVHELWPRIDGHFREESTSELLNSEELLEVWNELYKEAMLIPNSTSPSTPIGDETEARIVKLSGRRPTFDRMKVPPRLAEEILRTHGTLRDDITNECGEKSYAFLGNAATLERCLIDFTADFLLRHSFTPIIVPDILNVETPVNCGMAASNEQRKLIYTFKHESTYCLSGTGEMGVASFIENTQYDSSDLPLKFYTISRCYRPEVAVAGEEKSIYRVHEFNKVEMFAVTANETGQESGQMLNYFVDLQQELFSSLGLHFRLLEMPSQELGAAAHRKFDIEAWMPGRNVFGEISSASNCTDYQARRLHCTYRSDDKRVKHVHTVNGTACATTRMIIALIEQNQTFTKSISLPSCLQTYMDHYNHDRKQRIKWKRNNARTILN